MMTQKENLKRYVEHGVDKNLQKCSPMDPPEPYDLPAREDVLYASYAKPIQILLDEHKAFLSVLANFEIALLAFKEADFTISPDISRNFKEFFEFMDQHTVEHNRKEEKALFPILRKYLIETGECSPGMNPTTPTDVMEGDHLQVSHATYLIFNLLGLSSRLTDAHSRHMVLQTVYEQGREIVETMKLHIYKENNVLIPLAHKYCNEQDLQRISELMGIDQQFAV